MKKTLSKKVAEEPSPWPMRINKYLAHEGVATRRAADELVARGKVLVNGKAAKVGDKVNEGDKVELTGGAQKPARYTYFAYHKPVGVITHSPGEGEEDVRENARKRDVDQVFPIGRLDKDSSGLMILTNDGRVTDRLLSPRYEHDKEYQVKTLDPLRESFKKHMEAGVNIEGYTTRPCKVRKTGEQSFVVTLTEGKKHQIRRMVAALHNQVTALKRTRIMNIRLEDLAPGDARPIMGDELTTFLTSLGIK